MTTIRHILTTAAGVLIAVCILDLIKWVGVERPSSWALASAVALLLISACAGVVEDYVKR